MQPRKEPLRNHRDTLLPLPFYRPSQSTYRPNYLSILNSRRVIQESHPSVSSNRFNIHQITNISPFTSQLEQPIDSPNDSVIPSESEMSCQYCNINITSESLTEHLEICDMRKINCERCGERVIIDTFEVHAEECNLQAQRQREQYLMRSNDLEEDDNTIEDNGNIDMDMDEEMYLSDSELTYERLLMLDANVEKKGMTIEQLKVFPIQLYVKSLDGEGYCVICMSDYQTGEYVRKLSCQHKFHKGCIDQWLDTNITCPTCKKYLR